MPDTVEKAGPKSALDHRPAGRVNANPADASATGRVPDFFIVGHAKCGTTALYETLRGHPQIHMPVKEPRFFAMRQIDLGARSSSEVTPPELQVLPVGAISDVPGRRPHTLEGYTALFVGARPGQLIGEASPAYLRSALAARRIAAVRPDARIIAILREPVSFLRSFHLQSLRGYNETERDLPSALALEAQRREGRRIPRLSRTPEDLLYSDHVRYVEQLRRYHAVFAREQVLVLVYEDFQRDNEAVVRRVLRFLEVDDTVTIAPVRTRPSRDLRFNRLHALVNLRRTVLRNVSAARAFSHCVNTITPARLRGAVRTRWRGVAYGEPAALDEPVVRELRRRYAHEVHALSAYLDRDLVDEWGYGDRA